MQKYSQIAKAILGSLILTGAIVPAAKTQTTEVFSCPGIYYEEPYNSRLIVPQGCPPNARTEQELEEPGISPELTPSSTDLPTSQTPPLPEERSEPIATIMPSDGQVGVKLKNDTNVSINYEVVGHTQRRALQPGEAVMLQNLPVPVTITVERQDDGLLNIIPQSSESAMLELTLDENPNFDDTQGVLRIREDGKVFVN